MTASSVRGLNMKPMLSAKLSHEQDILLQELKTLNYPVIGSPKIDGIRIICHPTLGAVTRTLKPLPNIAARTALSDPTYSGLDGEIVVGKEYREFEGDDVYNRTTSVMAGGGQPDIRYWVFDDFSQPELPFRKRTHQAATRVGVLGHPRIHYLPWVDLRTPEEVLFWEEKYVSEGYEGLMLRNPDAPYKFGRSTLKQQYLIKLKRFVDDEAVILDVIPRRQNNNTPYTDNLGYQKRTAHQENKVELPMVGAFVCRSANFEKTFEVGSGFDHAFAERWWTHKDKAVGKTIRYKYQECGTLEKPRQPIFLNFREPE